MSANFPAATVLGYPRIGADRELKFALEKAWSSDSPAETEALRATADELRKTRTARLRQLGLKAPAAVPEDFSYYDQVLDIVIAAGAVPARFAAEAEALRAAKADPEAAAALAAQFTVARGEGDRAALEMTKWFDSNYHYLVPEIGPETELAYNGSPRVAAARALGGAVRPVLVGPVTFLALAKPTEEAGAGYNPLDRLDDLVAVYAELLAELADAGVEWVQFDEPALVTDRHRTPQDRGELLAALERAYTTLSDAAPKLAVVLSYGHAEDAVDVLAEKTSVEAVGVDLVRGREPEADTLARWSKSLSGRTLIAGAVSGRNIWRADLDAKLAQLVRIRTGLGDQVALSVSTSTSLQHVPQDVERETGIDPEIRSWLAFADQKVRETAVLAAALAEGEESVADEFAVAREALRTRADHPGVKRAEVREATAAVTDADRRRSPYEQRRAAQEKALDLPLLPTTTIGSFPQTGEIRKTRAAFRKGNIDEAAYTEAMNAEIEKVIRAQEEIGLDVLVHGEPERNDMVQYFCEHFDGCLATTHGWVQSYGSRCTRPSVLWGDISRPEAITVPWSSYAQSLTDKPVKGMLTGPVTIMAWSFVREDIAWGEVADQIGLALRAEVADLEAAGIGVIQVDEPAIRELLPLRAEDREDYLAWSVGSFRLATSGAADQTSIHTHLCYSDFATIVDAIDRLDADVTSVEASRSRLKVLPALAEHGFERGLGPGVWDIHSARVPSQDEVRGLIDIAVDALDPRQVWVNPDCGLKTRAWPETTATLKNLVAAAAEVRERLQK
ncbi:5-methyltetrahydropteroyltriglutamate--homocysteine methyltransferase [Corynebacterium frankenforstense DSM 45800]|uniref:5-methyltetrahydropteroyltriglutamate--homocysteine S-methyltransferase n=1 Tax=Corynebacterium frankenforstense DSM 45800 TaxID=1437875 RepID=A0A1L7CSK1_9CORY|nr:5-methyltetrahydropteroyltriglutamate--homocysteine S-methyltransferase [Corynebacterium frankenforstense]APT88809.1 5-methyltetrahydropteroyltriglutamate--homocysteine methyltransferase [Corynebacterium frankenforstense DSM 45800]